MEEKDQDLEPLIQDHNMTTIQKDPILKSVEKLINTVHLHGKEDLDLHQRKVPGLALRQEDLVQEKGREKQDQDQKVKFIQDPDQEEDIQDQDLPLDTEINLGLNQEEEIQNQLMIGVYQILHQFHLDMYHHPHHPPHLDMILTVKTCH